MSVSSRVLVATVSAGDRDSLATLPGAISTVLNDSELSADNVFQYLYSDAFHDHQTYTFMFLKFLSAKFATNALLVLNGSHPLLAQFSNCYQFPDLPDDPPLNSPYPWAFCKFYGKSLHPTPCPNNYSHHPRDLFNIEHPTLENLSHLWFSDFRCGSWGLRYGRALGLKGANLFEKIVNGAFEENLVEQTAKYKRFTKSKEQVLSQWEKEEKEAIELLQRTESDIAELIQSAVQLADVAKALKAQCDSTLAELPALVQKRQEACRELLDKSTQITFQAVNWRYESVRKIVQALGTHVVERVTQCGEEDFSYLISSSRVASRSLCNQVIAVPQRIQACIASCKASGTLVNVPELRSMLQAAPDRSQLLAAADALKATLTRTTAFILLMLDLAICSQLEGAPANADQKKENKRKAKIADLVAKIDTAVGLLPALDVVVRDFPPVLHLAGALSSVCAIQDTDGAGSEVSATPAHVVMETVNAPPLAAPAEPIDAEVDVTAAVPEGASAPIPMHVSTMQAAPTDEMWSAYYAGCTAALVLKQEENPACSIHCKCKAHNEALLRCTDCDVVTSQYCETCAAAHLRNIRNKKHHLFRLCPVCGDYSSLHYCVLCLAAGILDDALTCGTCQSDRHLELNHECSLLDAFAGTPSSASSNSPLQGNSPAPATSPAISTAASPLPPTPPAAAVMPSPPAPLPMGNVSTGSSAVASAILSASASASTLDKERLYMVHSRAAIEEVAQPVVIAYFKRRWEQIAPLCLGCKVPKKHPFEQVNVDCLQHIVRNLHYNDSAFQCVKRMNLAKYNNDIAECLQCSFDLGAVGNLVKAFEFDTQGVCPSVVAIADLVALRGTCFHQATMDMTARDDLIKLVKLNCCKIAAPMLPQFAWKVDRIADALQRVQESGGDVLLKFKEQILRETQRQTDLQVHRLVSSTFAAAVVARSKEIADMLCSDDQLKFLVIPKLVGAQPDEAGKETLRRAQHRAALRFLLDVSWAGILDMNQLWFTDPNTQNTLDIEAFCKLEVTTVLKTDLSCYGKTSTLYSSLDADIMRLRSHFQSTHCQIVVVGFGDLSYSDESMRKLMLAFHCITSPLYANEHDWQAVPIVEDVRLLLNTYMRGVFCATDESSADPGAPSSVDLSAAMISELAFVESFVSGRVSKASNVWLPASKRFCGRIGFPAKALTVYAACLEVLTFNCEETPLYVTLDEITALETTFGEEQVRNAVADMELQRFLRGGKKASWLLYSTRPCKIVERDIVNDIVSALRLQNHNTITLTHAIGAGATTIGRNVLFELRHEFLCVAIFASVSDVSGICDLFRELSTKTDLPLLVLLDFHASSTRLYDIRNKLMHRNVFFLCTALIERGVDTSLPTASLRVKIGRTVFTKASATSQELMCTLPFVPNPEEQKEFAQLSVSREVFLDGRCLTPYFTQLGNLDIPKLFASAEQQPAGQETLVEAILLHSNEVLVKAGFNPIDIVDLRAEYAGYRKGHTIVRCRRDVALAPVLYGLFAFDPEYARRASSFALSVLHDHLDVNELSVIKLCIFYALFAPSQKVPLKVASYVCNGNIMQSKPVVWSHSMLQLIEVDATPPGYISIKVLKLAYVLAESPKVFDDRLQWHAKIAAYLHETLFAMLSHVSTYQSDLLDLVEPGFVQAFVEFKIWHPETTRHQAHAGKVLSYSFLVELVLQESKKPGNYEKVKELMTALFKLYRDSESQVFSTHTARFLTNYAEKMKKFSALCEAETILLSLLDKDVSTVCDRLGHVYKSHVRIIYSLLSSNKLRLTYGKDQDAGEAKGPGYLHEHPGQDYSTIQSIAFSTVFDIALLADKWFAKAMKLSKYSVPNPMIGAAQVWDTVLAIVKYALCADSAATFREYYDRTRQHGAQQWIFDQIRHEEVFEWCEDYLQGARSAAKYKRKQHEQDRSEKEYFTQHGQEATNGKIWELWDSLEKYQKAELDVREFTGFNLAIVKHWMTGKKNYEMSCDKLCFCILTLANHIFPFATATVEAAPTELAGPKPSAASAAPSKSSKSAGFASSAKGANNANSQTVTKAPSAPAAAKRALNIGACMEMFFQASCLLTSHPPSATASALNYFSERYNRSDLCALMHPHTLQPKLERWVQLSAQGSDFGLSARVSMVAILLWRILINGETNTFAALKTFHDALETEADSYFFRNKARLFLSKNRHNRICNPFSSFYFYDALPFASQLSGRPYRDHESVYCSQECYDCLHVCEGVLKKAQRNYFVVSCQQLQLEDIFMFSGDSTSHMEENQKVTFVLAIRDGGLIALGVRAVEKDAGK